MMPMIGQSTSAERTVLLWTGQTDREFRVALAGGQYMFVVYGQSTNLTLHVELKAGDRWIPIGLNNSHTIRRQDLQQIGSSQAYRGTKLMRLPAGLLRIRSSDTGASPEVRIAGAGR